MRFRMYGEIAHIVHPYIRITLCMYNVCILVCVYMFPVDLLEEDQVSSSPSKVSHGFSALSLFMYTFVVILLFRIRCALLLSSCFLKVSHGFFDPLCMYTFVVICSLDFLFSFFED